VCKNKNKVEEIAISATSSLVLKTRIKIPLICLVDKLKTYGQNIVKVEIK
jgi:hypothetical protein